MRSPLSRRTAIPFHGDLVLQPPRELDAGDVHRPPEDIACPEADRKANEPADEETHAVLGVCLLAGKGPDAGHDRVSQRMEDGSVHDVEGEGDSAQVLRQPVGE